MRLTLTLVLGALCASGILFLWRSRTPETLLVDASGRALTAGPAPAAERGAAPEADPFARSRRLIEERDLRTAKTALLELLEAGDHDGEACILLSEATREAGEVDEAHDYALKAVELLPDDPRAHVAHARALGAQAMAELDSLAGLLAAMPRIHRMRGAAGRALELDPDNVDARKLLVLMQMAPPPVGDLDRALELCAEIAERDPGPGRYWSAVVYERRGETDRAVELCRSGLEEFPDEPGFALVLAGILAEREDYGEADELFGRLLAGPRCAESFQAMYQAAKMRIEAGFDLERAVRLLDDYIAADPLGDFLPRPAHAWWRKGLALEGLGRTEEARAAYERSRSLDPDFDAAAEALAGLKGGA